MEIVADVLGLKKKENEPRLGVISIAFLIILFAGLSNWLLLLEWQFLLCSCYKRIQKWP